ncbi:MAG: hypothetical protein K2L61_02465 [Clostridia bacterium]|nr:hypothetical protein [Clostridia bacterium]
MALSTASVAPSSSAGFFAFLSAKELDFAGSAFFAVDALFAGYGLKALAERFDS